MQERLQKIIDDKNLTSTKFASLIGVNASTISHILAGRNKPGYDIIKNIAKIFPDINLNWLLTGDGDIYNSSSNRVENYQNELKVDDSFYAPEVYNLKSAKNETKRQEEPKKNDNVDIATIKNTSKRLKRIILIFEDNSIEYYDEF